MRPRHTSTESRALHPRKQFGVAVRRGRTFAADPHGRRSAACDIRRGGAIVGSGTMKRRLFVAQVSLLLLPLILGSIACSGSGSSGSVFIQSASCEATLSGAVSASVDCRPATTTADTHSGNDFFQFGAVWSNDGGPEVGITTIIYFLGVAPGTYQNTDVGALGGIDVSGPGVWSTLQPGGSYQLVLASVSNATEFPGGTVYDAEGSLDATLTASSTSGATGVVSLHATF